MVRMRGRWMAVLLGTALVLYACRHPIALRLARHRPAPHPDTSREPIQAPPDRDPFDLWAGGRRYRVTPRFRWDESARVVSERAYRFGAAGSLFPEARYKRR